MGYWGSYAPYVSVAQRRAKAEKAAATAKKSGHNYSPIQAYRGAVAKTFWGKAWCDNLEAYSDFSNRLPRGATYVRNGSVIDLQIEPGHVKAMVMGSELYSIAITVKAVPQAQWQAIGKVCAGSISSVVDLLQGKLDQPVMQCICKPQTGLFPAPHELQLSCSCPDYASMCKHVAAVLYGVGARLDSQPELLFKLRNVDSKDLIVQASAGLPSGGKRPTSSRVLADSGLADVFGLEMAESAPQLEVLAKSVNKPAKKALAKPVAKTAKPVAKAAKPAAKKLASKKAVAKTLPIQKPVVKKTAAGKLAPKKLAAKKASVGQAVIKKVPAARKPVTKTATAKKSPVKKLIVKKTVATKTVAKKSTAKKVMAKRPTPKKAVAKKATAKAVK